MHDASQNVPFSGVASVPAALRSTVTFHTLAELSLVNNDEPLLNQTVLGGCILSGTIYVFTLR